jgi:hypothetical protein
MAVVIRRYSWRSCSVSNITPVRQYGAPYCTTTELLVSLQPSNPPVRPGL